MRTLWNAWWLSFVLVISVAPAWAADDVVAQARALAGEGRFKDAEALLRQHIADPNAPITDPVAIELEILRRIRLDFHVTPEQVAEQIGEQIPHFNPAEVERMQKQGLLQSRVIDGQTWYFDRAAGNVFRLNEGLRLRRTPPLEPAGGFDRVKYVRRLLALADAGGQTEVSPIRHHVRYELAVKEGNPRVKAGAKVRCWLPFPQEYRQQRDVRLLSSTPTGAVIAPVDQPQRSVYFETTIDDPNVPPKFVAEFEFTTSAVVPRLDPDQAQPYDTQNAEYQEFTAERPPHIVFTPEVKRLAAEIVGDETNPVRRAQRVFRWVSDNITWVGEMEYSTIPCLSGKGLQARCGDCGVQSLTFITLCRAAGIPARWQSGWSTRPGDENMHDWSEIYLPPWGWLPADASWGVLKDDDPRVQNFYCGGLDGYRLIVNRDYGRELSPPKQSFRSEPVDFQRGEIEIDGHNLYFNEWRWRFDVTAQPLEGGVGALEERFDALVPQMLAAEHIPGAVLAVGRKVGDHYETWQKAYGWQEIEPQRQPMAVDAIFDLASMTKPIATGTSIMMLVEQGKVGLKDLLGKYFPECATGEKFQLQVRHLLTHTSGMPPYVDAKARERIVSEARIPCADELHGYIHSLKLSAPIGKTVIYSCLNAIMAGEIVALASRESLDRFSAEHIFRPLKMVDTGYNPPREKLPRCVPTTRSEYAAKKGDFLRGEVHDPLALVSGGVSGNAGLFSTGPDLARFAQMMLNGGELDGVHILQPETVQAMLSVQNEGALNRDGKPDRRGWLWDLYVPDPGDKGIDALFAAGHTGYTGTAIRLYPQQGVYIIALTNRVHPDDTAKVERFRRGVWETVGQLVLGVKDTEK